MIVESFLIGSAPQCRPIASRSRLRAMFGVFSVLPKKPKKSPTFVADRFRSAKIFIFFLCFLRKLRKKCVFGGPRKQRKTRVRVYRCAGGSKMTFFRSK